MLPEFKKRIDILRQILVGAVPSPAGQIEQITFALIYKFMNDIDDRATSLPDGKRTYFVGDYDKYSWHNIMAPTLGAHDRLTLYREALVSLAKNPNLPELFQSIYQNAYLPFNDPRVLTLFLKEVDHFKHSNSDDIGDAYEYLLQITGAQGDVGQFRTPRHIINFIVEAIAPTKDDSVLDPACGTAGFLISAYNYVKHQHDGIDNATGKPNNERQLTSDELNKLHKNYHGFDIDPTMVRTAKVNMYLHGFKEPDIKNHDSLSSEDFWNERYDVILANPPFMTPKGGIVPHKKFGVQSNRAEVLFVDYIKSHLKPTGRAGIIVPEGIIFQSGTAYKQLRKSLVEDGLYAVVSLPSGIFAPYSGVKTSVLLFDNELTKTKKEILFIKVSSDGFDLGAQRREITNNDLPKALEILDKWKKSEKVDEKIVTYVEKAKIAESGDYNLSGDRYRVVTDYSNAKWPMVKFEEICELGRGFAFKSEDYIKEGILNFRVTNIGNDGLPDLSNSKYLPAAFLKKYEQYQLQEGDFMIVMVGATTGKIGVVTKNILPALLNQNMWRFLPDESKVNKKYLYYLAQSFDVISQGGAQGYLTQSEFIKREIPLPPLEVQEQIAAELDGYQNIITGAKQIITNWKPRIEIDQSWEMVKLEKVVESTKLGVVIGKKDQDIGKIPYIKMDAINNGFIDLSKAVLVDYKSKEDDYLVDGDFVYNTRNAPNLVGKSAVFHSNKKYLFNNNILRIRFNKDKVDSDFIAYYMNGDRGKESVTKLISGTTSVAAIYQKEYLLIEVPLPTIAFQKQIVSKIEDERTLVESAKKLIEIYEQKTKSKIAEVWSK